jgi:hypothetical protein
VLEQVVHEQRVGRGADAAAAQLREQADRDLPARGRVGAAPRRLEVVDAPGQLPGGLDREQVVLAAQEARSSQSARSGWSEV